MGCNCGKSRTGGTPQYAVTTTRSVDGTSARVQFRTRYYFTLNDQQYVFAPTQISQVPYTVIYAALLTNPSGLFFLIDIEKQDFLSKYPDVEGYPL